MSNFWWKNLHLSKVLEGCSRRMFNEITARTPLILEILYCIGWLLTWGAFSSKKFDAARVLADDGRVVMKWGRPHKDEDLKEKRISSEFLQFTVFVAEGEALGAYGQLVSQTRRVIFYSICLFLIRTNILILMIKQKSFNVVSTYPPPARYNLCAINCRPCLGSKGQTLPSRMVNLKRRCQVSL